MVRLNFGPPILFVIFLLIAGCSNPSDPTAPDPVSHMPSIGINHNSSTQLWGYSEISIDTDSLEITQVKNRTTQFTANVTNFLNLNPLSLTFSINEIVQGPDYIDVDIDVGITHPFPGMPQYHGYDVRGLFIGDGSDFLVYNPDLIYADQSTNQFMPGDPDDGRGVPDGYSRWYNLPEFSEAPLPLFNYTPGAFATPGYGPSATINPYRYFADALGADDDLFDWLVTNPDMYGVFSSGATNSRNYYIRFPNPDPGVVFGYSVIANWEGEDAIYHPSNANEAVACDVVDSSSVYYVDPTTNGGSIILDVSVFDWSSSISAGLMEDYRIFIESTVLSVPYEFNGSEMTPVDGDENFSTYQVEIPAGEVTGPDNNEFWIIVEYANYDYTNDLGFPNLAGDDPLAAFFRYDLDVTDQPTEIFCDVIVTGNSPAMPYEGWGVFEFDASESSDPAGNPLSFEWDFNNDGVFGDSYEAGTDEIPQKLYDFVNLEQVCVKVTNGLGGESICCVDVDITGHQMKNIELRSDATAVDVGIDHANGDLIVVYDDAGIYKRPRSTWYGVENHFVDISTLTPIPYFIDVVANSYVYAGITYTPSECPGAWLYEPDGTFVHGYGINCGHTYLDVAAMGTNGVFANDILMVEGYTYLDVDWIGVFNWDYPYEPGHWYDRHSISDYNYEGVDRLYYQYVKAVETDATGDFIWFLEDPDYYASRWFLSAVGFVGYMDYDNAYFGTGSQTDDDDGWNDARDICRDDQNRYFVLDKLTNDEPRLKLWTVDGDTTTSLGAFGNSTSIDGEPVSVEGSDFEGHVVVLHGNTVPQKVSVFHPIEMPG